MADARPAPWRTGCFLESPSDAVDPALAAKAIMVLGLVGSTLANPRPIAREASVRFIVLENGLSRQASRMIKRSCLAGSTANSARSTGMVSSRTSPSVSSVASVGTR